MESLDTAAPFMGDFLDFSDEEDDYETPQTSANHHHLHHHCTPFSLLHCTDALTHSFPGYVEEEEELEWISNKDTFPMVESLVDFIPNIASSNYNDILNTSSSINNNHQSPISVLENSTSSGSGSGSGGFTATLGHGRSVNNGRNMMMINLSSNFKVPGKARTKHGRKRREMLGPQFQCWSKPAARPPKSSSIIGRKCLHCGSEKTPQWRAGPLGPKTLCNACGVRYKSGRLCDEYRPASSPTFSNELHSNSHRKVVELRRLKNEKIMMMMGTGFALKPGPADIV